MALPARRAAAGCGLPIRVVSRRLVRASDPSIRPHVLAVSHLDLYANTEQCALTCVYPKPPTGAGDFDAVVAAFEAHMPAYLNYFFPMAGRIVVDPSSGIPELHCYNQGAELIVAHAGVELSALDWSLSGESLKRIHVPYAQDMVLSVQLLSFTCGGFAVVWAANNLVGDGNVGVMLVRMWTELVRTGTISGGGPNHDRSVLRQFSRPRDPPTYGASVAAMYTRWEHEQEVNALTAEESFIERLYYVDERDIARLRGEASAEGRQRATRVQAVSAYLWKVLAGIVATSKLLGEDEKRCRLLWWVDGRRRFSSPELRSSLRNYAGNVTSYVVAAAAAATVLSKPLAGVAAMVREAVTLTPADYDELYQQMVDWMEVHKPTNFVETPAIGLGSPTLAQTMWSSFPNDTDFGFGEAALAMPVHQNLGRLCMGLICITPKPADPGTWIVSAFIWPRLAAVLESDEQRIFKPLTAEFLGLTRGHGLRPRL
uniref:Anthranilate N-benzoyltransferase protein 1 n=2 Tax=Aegilops tauschii subsp. strangulata TaxID=200361 RepID=A0A453IZA9_AEGTS